MRRKTKRKWVRQLDRIREAYNKEKEKRPRGQTLITKYLATRKETESREGFTTGGDGERSDGNPARSPREAPSPEGDAVS